MLVSREVGPQEPGTTRGDAVDRRAISSCRSAADLRAWLLAYGRAHGFYGARYVHLGHLGWADAERAQHLPVRFLSTSYLAAHEDAQWLGSDPAIAQVRAGYAPFVWTTRGSAAADPAQRTWLDDQRARGVSAGVAVPVQDCAGGPAYLSLFGIDEAGAARLVEARAPELAFTAAQFHALAKSLVAPAPWVIARAKLSAREIECLRLAALGKTVDESSAVLAISSRTVEFHIGNALAKLGAPTKLRAVVIALAAGLMSDQSMDASRRVRG
jgi:LuxR family transcriptional activator of conjugal transfer of Ti plasmids